MTGPGIKVWVVVSDCGLNGPWIHGVSSEEPAKAAVDACTARARRTTGYQSTSVEAFDLDGELRSVTAESNSEVTVSLGGAASEAQVADGGWPLAGLLTAEEKELIRAAGMDPDKLMLVWESDRSAD